jgi:hypothetical protein
VLRYGLGLCLLVVLALVIRAATELQSQPSGFLASGTSAVVVLDMSLSISRAAYPIVGTVLRDIVRRDSPTGFVIFSDSPYELLPPGSPGSELRPFLRYFTPLPGRDNFGQLMYRANPWSDVFRGGTRISGALQTAALMLRRDHTRHGSVLLLSDLETAPSDVPALTSTLLALRQGRIPLRVVPLLANPQDRQLFATVAGRNSIEDISALRPASGSPRAQTRAGLPWTLLATAGVLIGLLALNELLLARLPLPSHRRGATV